MFNNNKKTIHLLFLNFSAENPSFIKNQFLIKETRTSFTMPDFKTDNRNI